MQNRFPISPILPLVLFRATVEVLAFWKRGCLLLGMSGLRSGAEVVPKDGLVGVADPGPNEAANLGGGTVEVAPVRIAAGVHVSGRAFARRRCLDGHYVKIGPDGRIHTDRNLVVRSRNRRYCWACPGSTGCV